MSGAGNDFLIIDHRDPFLTREDKQELARGACRRCFSAGADGLICIENSDQADFQWDFYNPDGSVAEMCGNGARCAARYAYRNGIAGEHLVFDTIAGRIEAWNLADGTVRINMTDPFDFRKAEAVELDGSEYEAWFVNTGVPHVVIFANDENAQVAKWGRQVRFDKQFQPAGTNVNFVCELPDGSYLSRTYERGVEEETRACGTGAVASALYVVLEKQVVTPVKIITSGGEQLTIDFQLSDGPVAKNVTMQGPARFIYEGQLSAESLS